MIAHNVPHVRRLIVGIGTNRWCRRSSSGSREAAVFPDWLYDESRVNDLPSVFNLKTVEAAYEQLEVELGFEPPKASRRLSQRVARP